MIVGFTILGRLSPYSPSTTDQETSTPFSKIGTSGRAGMTIYGPIWASEGEALTASNAKTRVWHSGKVTSEAEQIGLKRQQARRELSDKINQLLQTQAPTAPCGHGPLRRRTGAKRH